MPRDYTDPTAIWNWRKGGGQMFTFNELISMGGIRFILLPGEMQRIDQFVNESYRTNMECYSKRSQGILKK